MARTHPKFRSIPAALTLLFFIPSAAAQQPDPQNLVTTGQTTLDGQSRSYLIRHLPINAFPQLPQAIQTQLNQRGCLIPQTYAAHAPENVVHASLQHPGSSDWAALCSVNGSVSLLVFFGDSGSDPTVVTTALETDRLQLQPALDTLGFNWSLDAVSPQAVHQAQLGMRHTPPRPDHDALADSIVDRKTIYRFYTRDQWTTLDTRD